LAVAFRNNSVYVADTYNQKIKTIDLATGQTRTLSGGNSGLKDGDPTNAQFNEPGGLSIASDKLYIADTNNHAIRVLDLESKAVSTLKLQNLSAPVAQKVTATPTRLPQALVLPLQKLAPNARGELMLDVKLPPGYHLNLESPQRFEAKWQGRGVTLGKTRIRGTDFKLPLRVAMQTSTEGRGTLDVVATVFYCVDQKGECIVKDVRLQAPFEIATGGTKQLKMEAAITSDKEVKLR
jgi:hypothetical protein